MSKPWKSEERRLKAIAHNEEMAKTFSINTEESIRTSEIYLTGPKQTYEVKVIKSTSEEAVFTENGNGITAVLNFASFTSPGGGFITGAIAQEEALCHASNLYNILSAPKFESFYLNNKKPENYRKGLYTDALIYTQDVVFCQKNDDGLGKTITIEADVITCAAPNWSAASKNKVSAIDNRKALHSRIQAIIDAANQNFVDTLILGAFGCGVFGQSSIEVAMIFYEEIKNSTASHIVFAIPDDLHFKVFKEVFKDLTK